MKNILKTLNDLLSKGRVTFSDIKNTLKTTLTSFLYQKTRRNPMIIPVIMNKKYEDGENNYKFVKKEPTKTRRTKKVAEE